jgi:hypothetical protein
MSTRPDLMIELDSLIDVWAYTPAGAYHMRRMWGRPTYNSQAYPRWQLDSALLDPFIHGAAMAGLLLVVRKSSRS